MQHYFLKSLNPFELLHFVTFQAAKLDPTSTIKFSEGHVMVWNIWHIQELEIQQL